MGLSDVNFTLGQGGLGAQAPGTDYYSGLIFWPAETKATATYQVTNAGATNDTVDVKVLQQTSTGPQLVTIASYTRQSGDTTATLVATAIKNAINAGTSGYTATSSTDTITITAAKGQGKFLNSGTPLSVVIVGTVAGTITQFSGGVDNLPSGVGLFDRIKLVFQIQDAENLGIKNDYSDETQATGTYLVTNAGATGDVIAITVTEPQGVVKTIASYTRSSAASTTALLATAITAAINALTSSTGYSASVGSSTVTITARKGLGKFVNSGTPIVATITGTIAGTITQFSGGVASLQAVWHYHISEFFRIQTNKQGICYLYFAIAPSGSPDFTEIQTLQNSVNGKIKQMGVYVDFTAYASSHFNTIQGICNTLAGLHMPVSSVVYSADMSATTISAITLDLGTLTDPNVSVALGQDGAALGNYLYQISKKSIGTVGIELGTTAQAAVSQSIAEVGAFNISDGTELDTAAFATGELNVSFSDGALGQLDAWGYTFLRKFKGTTTITGTYFNGSRTAVNLTSDYAFVERVRTIDKAIRGVRESLLPIVNKKIPLNPDGTIQFPTIADIETNGGVPLNNMASDGDISAYSVTVDPAQKILQTNILLVNIKIVPEANAKEINVTIGYVPKI